MPVAGACKGARRNTGNNIEYSLKFNSNKGLCLLRLFPEPGFLYRVIMKIENTSALN